MAEMAARAHEISLEAGSKMTAAMRDVVGAAAGISAFAIESARDLVNYMVRRGQMSQEEATKLMLEVEEAHAKLPKSDVARTDVTPAKPTRVESAIPVTPAAAKPPVVVLEKPLDVAAQAPVTADPPRSSAEKTGKVEAPAAAGKSPAPDATGRPTPATVAVKAPASTVPASTVPASTAPASTAPASTAPASKALTGKVPTAKAQPVGARSSTVAHKAPPPTATGKAAAPTTAGKAAAPKAASKPSVASKLAVVKAAKGGKAEPKAPAKAAAKKPAAKRK